MWRYHEKNYSLCISSFHCWVRLRFPSASLPCMESPPSSPRLRQAIICHSSCDGIGIPISGSCVVVIHPAIGGGSPLRHESKPTKRIRRDVILGFDLLTAPHAYSVEKNAEVAKLADALAEGARAASDRGSSPLLRTNPK